MKAVLDSRLMRSGELLCLGLPAQDMMDSLVPVLQGSRLLLQGEWGESLAAAQPRGSGPCCRSEPSKAGFLWLPGYTWMVRADQPHPAARVCLKVCVEVSWGWHKGG